MRSRVSSQWMVLEFYFSSPSLKKLTLVWSPRTLGCTSGGPEGAARRFEVSFSAAEGPGKRTPGKPGVPGHCPRHWVCDTGALGFSTHTKVVDVCCALGGEDAGVRDHPCTTNGPVHGAARLGLGNCVTCHQRNSASQAVSHRKRRLLHRVRRTLLEEVVPCSGS